MRALPVILPPLFAPALLLALAFCACPVSAQAVSGSTQHPQRLVFSSADVVTTFYTPEYTNVHELMRIAERLHGRHFHVEERGGVNSPSLSNMQQLGDSILIYDLPDYTETLLKALALLDRSSDSGRPAPGKIVTEHWAPGFVSVDTGLTALQPFSRSVFLRDDMGREHAVGNVSMLQDQNLLVLRDSPEQVEQMLALLSVIDQPEPQLMVTAMVIRGDRGASGEDVPRELAANLSKLVPYESFALDAMGIVRSSARARTIQIELGDQHRFEFKPDAFDGRSQSLSGMCQFQSTQGFEFETRTSVRAGEYTVLGASGEIPLFVVLRIQPLDK